MAPALVMVACNDVEAQWLVVAPMAPSFFGKGVFGKGVGARGWAMPSDTAPREIAGLSVGSSTCSATSRRSPRPIVIGAIVQATGSFGGALAFVGANALGANALDVTAGTVPVLRNAGPQGGPDMPEWGMLPMPRKLPNQGHRDMLRLSDARMSGAGDGADAHVLCFALIETARAVADVAATPGLDGLCIGAADLRPGLTGRRHRTGFDREEPEMVDAIHRSLAAAKAAGLRAALHRGNPACAATAVGRGVDTVTLPNDVRILVRGAAADVAEARAASKRGAGPP